jgi:hypothetical protein
MPRRGRQIEITAPTECSATFDMVDFYHNESRLIGLDTLKRDLVSSARILEKLSDGFRSRVYQPPAIDQIFPLEDARHAYECVFRGTSWPCGLEDERSLIGSMTNRYANDTIAIRPIESVDLRGVVLCG